MTDTIQQKRWQEIINIWQDNRWLYTLAGVLLGILILPALEQFTGDLNELVANLVPEAIGIVFTVLVIDSLAKNRDLQQYKENLIFKASSLSNENALSALDELWHRKWLFREQGILKDAFLQRANWQNAYLGGAYLENSDLSLANLKNAHFLLANLEGTNLSGANLEGANLEGANLKKANLSGTNLRGTNLNKVVLFNNQFNENTILPDGSFWSKDRNLRTFGALLFDQYNVTSYEEMPQFLKTVKTPFIDSTDSLVGLVGIGRDITFEDEDVQP